MEGPTAQRSLEDVIKTLEVADTKLFPRGVEMIQIEESATTLKVTIAGPKGSTRGHLATPHRYDS
jgi:hypothetical protein